MLFFNSFFQSYSCLFIFIHVHNFFYYIYYSRHYYVFIRVSEHDFEMILDFKIFKLNFQYDSKIYN